MGSRRVGEPDLAQEDFSAVKDERLRKRLRTLPSVPAWVLVVSVAFPLLRIQNAWPPRGYVDMAALALQWTGGLLLVGAVFSLISRTLAVIPWKREWVSSWGCDRIADALSSAFAVFFTVFMWQVLLRCQKGELWDRDGLVCLARGALGRRCVFLQSFSSSRTGAGWDVSFELFFCPW